MAFTPGNSNGTMNGATQVDIVVAPGSSTQREVANVSFFNRDTAAPERRYAGVLRRQLPLPP